MISNVTITADNNTYYPTPKNLADKMLEKISDILSIKTVLEPSAGAGDLVQAILDYYNKKEEERETAFIKRYGMGNFRSDRILIHCVEPDKSLTAVLNDRFKECLRIRHIYDNFLTLKTYKKYDLVLMNPPFKNGDEHLLKAIDMQKRYGGQIICLLNAETILNPYSNKRKLLKKQLDDLNADIEYIEGAFIGSDAERKTEVKVALININIEAPCDERDFFDELQKAREIKAQEEPQSYNLIHNDFILQMIELFNYEIEETLKLVEAYNKIKPNLRIRFNDETYNYPIVALKVGSSDFDIDLYLRSVRSKYWEALFNKKEFMGMFTSNLQERYRGMLDKLSAYDFNMYNIEIVKQDMLAGLDEGLSEAIMSLFEKLSITHSWYDECKNNIHYFNGWKTNTAHKINNKKVILPINGYSSYYFGKGSVPLDEYKIKDNLSDIEKVLNYLDMGETENVDLGQTIKKAAEEGQTKKIPFKYFFATFYKKGTCHIEFRPECRKLIDKLNIYGSQKKGWLPPDYGRKRYSDMADEEKTVIDDFQGKEAYEKVCANSEYYLMDTSNLLQLQGITG